MSDGRDLRLAIREAVAQGNVGRVKAYVAVCKAEGQTEAAKTLTQIANALATNLWSVERALWVFDNRLPWQRGFFDD